MGNRGPGGDAASAAVTIGAFGSVGSFTEEAAHRYVEREGLQASISSSPDLEQLFADLNEGRLTYLCLPINNSIGGLVRATFEVLGRNTFEPVAQVELPIRHALLVRSGLDLARITTVASHPQALIQCDRFLKRHLPEAERMQRSDTASAARELSTGELTEETAVIASLRAAEHFGLAVLEKDIQDLPDNRTNFLILGRIQ